MNAKTIEAIASRSLVNCHAMGVDSLVLGVDPILRIFVARENHTLWTNMPDQTYSVGFHNHHCDVTLVHLTGIWSNEMLAQSGGVEISLAPYRYESIIAGKSGAFSASGRERTWRVRAFSQPVNSPIFMRAQELHTIWVPRHSVAAWMVIEGSEDLAYKSVCWSNDDLTRWEPVGLYQPMSPSRVAENLKLIGL